MASVINTFFRDVFGADAVDHANCGEVEMSETIAHVVLESDFT